MITDEKLWKITPEIIAEIIALHDKIHWWDNKTKKMFKGIKGYLDKTAFGSEVKYARKENDSHEWMLDLVWWKKEYGAVMALESEASDRKSKSIVWDFKKLMSFKSPLKIFIFQQTKKSLPVVDEIRQTIKDFRQHSSSELYLIVEVGAKPKGGYYLYGFQPKHRGEACQSEVRDLGPVKQLFEKTTDKVKIASEVREMLSGFRRPSLQLV